MGTGLASLRIVHRQCDESRARLVGKRRECDGALTAGAFKQYAASGDQCGVGRNGVNDQGLCRGFVVGDGEGNFPGGDIFSGGLSSDAADCGGRIRGGTNQQLEAAAERSAVKIGHLDRDRGESQIFFDWYDGERATGTASGKRDACRFDNVGIAAGSAE